MNLIFHTFASLGAAIAFIPDSSGDICRDRLRRRMALLIPTGIMLHALCDLLPHHFPFDLKMDLILSLVLFAVTYQLVPGSAGTLIIAGFISGLIPDLIDKGPDFIFEFAGYEGCDIPIIFFWHNPSFPIRSSLKELNYLSVVSHVAIMAIPVVACILRKDDDSLKKNQ